MPALLQDLKTSVVHSDSSEVAAATCEIAVSANSAAPAELISSIDASNSVNTGSGASFRRVDAAHQGIPTPISMLSWRCDVSACRLIASPLNVNDLPSCARDQAALPRKNALSNEPPREPVGAQKQLTIVNDAADDLVNFRYLLAEAAHEIRAPIAVARQLLHSVQNRLKFQPNDLKAAMEFVDIADGRLQQACHWSENILTWRRLVDRHPVCVRKRFFPAQLKQQLDPLLSGLAKARKVDLEWIGWDRALPRLYTDCDLLSRVIINLSANAVNASRAGQKVCLRVAWQTNVVQRLVIAVEDLGPGLRKDLLDFVNGAKSCLPFQTGKVNNGIGLWNAKQLTASVGGSLSAQASKSGGTTLRLSLPVDDRISLVRSWLDQQAKLTPAKDSTSSETVKNRQSTDRPQVRMFVVRCDGKLNSPSTHISEAIQRQAGINDFIYKVSWDRWLWLLVDSHGIRQTIENRLKAAIELANLKRQVSGKWLIHQSHSWPWTPVVARAEERDDRAHFTAASILITLSQQVSKAMEEVMCGFTPPLDSLDSSHDEVVLLARDSAQHQTNCRIDSATAGPRLPKSIAQQSRHAGTIVTQPFEFLHVQSRGISMTPKLTELQPTTALQSIAAAWHKQQEWLHRSSK